MLACHADRMALMQMRTAVSAPGPEVRPTASAIDLARVSHDMRNPLTGMMGLTAILLESNLDDRQRRLTMLAKASAENLLGMVNDIMDLGRLEHGRLRLRRETVDIRRLAEQLIEVMRVQAGPTTVELRTAIATDVPQGIVSDGQRLRQVMGNLLSNAVKFTQQGHVELRIERIVQEGRSVLRFSVEDTGAGIAENEQGQLFSAFYQTATGSAYRGYSSGMGLAISKGIVEAMGGSIGVNSQLGAGSCFWFVLPLKEHVESI
jgi:two-component system sensor histidine kinase BarA